MMGDGGGKRIAEQKRPRYKGRAKGPPFVAIYHSVTDSAEFGRLSGNALKLLLELARQYRPGKNGDLSVPWSLLRDRGWKSQGTVADAKRELLEAGWLIETRKGGKNKCSLFAVTWYAIDASDKHLEPGTTTAPDLWRKRNA